jgi:hypothetical protein
MTTSAMYYVLAHNYCTIYHILDNIDDTLSWKVWIHSASRIPIPCLSSFGWSHWWWVWAHLHWTLQVPQKEDICQHTILQFVTQNRQLEKSKTWSSWVANYFVPRPN